MAAPLVPGGAGHGHRGDAGLAHLPGHLEDLVDYDFLARYGAAPTGSSPTSLGDTDGVPKSPEWVARHRPQLDPDDLRTLARRMTPRPARWSRCRGASSGPSHGEQPVWAGLALGLPARPGRPAGGGFGHGYGSMADVGNPNVSPAPAASLPREIPQPGIGPYIPVVQIAQAAAPNNRERHP